MPSIILNNIPFPDTDISDDHPNLALGRLMTAWGQIEVVCNFLFRRLTDLHVDAATIVFDIVGNKEQIEMLIGLTELLPREDQRKVLSDLLSSVKNLSTKRNKVIHASWGKLDGNPARFWSGLTSAHFDDIMSGSQKGGSHLQNHVHTVPQIESIFSKMVELRGQLEQALDFEMPEGPSSRRQREMFEEMVRRRELLQALASSPDKRE
ncbi:hypothetical protein [Mesorhizobium sp. M1B.F.Ca.ET.045.04.1.1]|uniref:hypothetical protein n=1 Tax=Mesorhizobium sp. M1B.F.Ca.ET.045.04.1.1 TaxID=2493673 RepID=UPI000F751D1C|nr:hypothetical protein [Mesorhizobium sp. M1B.F.Ca.ET.045.04.1.1]AZO29999.1 hypothetical protein EJ071_23125 [Mesorhizobium sp. M1B.F.Ca.ET.045.04.1.1]